MLPRSTACAPQEGQTPAPLTELHKHDSAITTKLCYRHLAGQAAPPLEVALPPQGHSTASAGRHEILPPIVCAARGAGPFGKGFHIGKNCSPRRAQPALTYEQSRLFFCPRKPPRVLPDQPETLPSNSQAGAIIAANIIATTAVIDFPSGTLARNKTIAEVRLRRLAAGDFLNHMEGWPIEPESASVCPATRRSPTH